MSIAPADQAPSAARAASAAGRLTARRRGAGERAAAELLLVEHPGARAGAVPWILDSRGRRTPGHDDMRRLGEVRAGLLEHPRVRARAADRGPREVERCIRALHEPGYLRALERAPSGEPRLIAELAPPGLEPDTPVCAEAVASAYEGAAVAIATARRLLAGARHAYALCRPPGHHAGPGWLGGYCYLNNAALAAQTLCEGGFPRVGILDVDLHYPNGTAAFVERMTAVTLHSLHGATGANLPWERVRARCERERLIAFRGPPALATYLIALATCVRALARHADAIVLSLGYDLIAGDPHGSWDFQPAAFAEIGRLVAGAGLPVCVVQEGGYALGSLAQCSHAFATGLLDAEGAEEVA
jgi:acetoin utilization deacetylase AcuC-like enzyme